MFHVTINIKPNTTVNVTETKTTEEAKTKRSRLWVKIATWAGALAGTVACVNDAFEILARLGIM